MASIFMRFPEGRKKALTLSYDDGVEQDVRLIEIMKSHGLKGTFNLNSGCYAAQGTVYPKGTIHRRMSKEECLRVYKNSGMEVAVHGLTHPFLEQLPVNMCVNEILSDRNNLEQEYGVIVRGMAYPFGTYNDSVVATLQQCGIVYARTVEVTRDFGIPTDWLRLKTTCHHNDPALMELAKKFVESEMSRSPGLFYLWGHSYEFESDNNWNVIEEFSAYMGGRNSIWYVTNIEIYDYIDAYNRLQFSTDGKRIFNPTCRQLWFENGEGIFSVMPGERLVM